MLKNPQWTSYWMVKYRKKILIQATTCRNLENIPLSERASHRESNTAWCHFHEVHSIVIITDTGITGVVPKGWGRGGMGRCCLMGIEFLYCKRKRVLRWMVLMVTQQCEWIWHCWTVHLKYWKKWKDKRLEPWELSWVGEVTFPVETTEVTFIQLLFNAYWDPGATLEIQRRDAFKGLTAQWVKPEILVEWGQ